MIYERKIYEKIKDRINDKEIIVLTGMRRTGKTTIFKLIFDSLSTKNKIFLDMENPLHQKIFEETNYDNILFNFEDYGINKDEKVYVFIDEIQLKPEIVKIAKYLLDHFETKFFLTGSSSFYLKNLFPESLSGRKLIFELYPLDFEEFLIFKEKKKVFFDKLSEKDQKKNYISYENLKGLYNEYLHYGGFPQVVLEKDKEKKKEKLTDIFNSYFEKEVKGLSDFKKIAEFRDLLLLLVRRTGTKLDINKLSSEIKVSRETVYSFLNFLEKTFFIKLISPISNSIDREITGTKKVYICDNGILNNLGHAEQGILFENAIFNNLIKYGEIKYYERRTGGEIDFIIKDKKTALEVKNKGTINDYLKLKKLSNDLKISECYVLTNEFVKDNGFITGCDV